MEALQGWRGSEGELALATATAGLREPGGCCCEEERPRRSKWRRGMARAGAGDVKATLRRVVAWLGRAEATRGRRR